VESKSIKLYLNSFNMTKLGDTAQECKQLLEQTVMEDLSKALHTQVKCRFFNKLGTPEVSMEQGFDSLDALVTWMRLSLIPIIQMPLSYRLPRL